MNNCSLDLSRLQSVQHLDGGPVRAACPACRAAGEDHTGDHLLIESSGKFGCAKYPGDAEHRKRIWALAGSAANAKPTFTGKPQIVATYDYTDEKYQLLYQVVRFSPKSFMQRRPDGNGGWIWKVKGVRRVVFGLPEIRAAILSGNRVFICEGEKDCLAMAKRGLEATCNAGGAELKSGGSKWLADYDETFRGADVAIISDKDATGRQHAQVVAGHLCPVAKSVRVIELPDVDGKPVKDAFDFFAAGGTAEQIGQLVNSTPLWIPTAPVASTEAPGTATGFDKITADLRGGIVDALTDEDLSAPAMRDAVAAAVVNALNSAGRFFFHAELRDHASAMYFTPHRKRLERIGADSFQSWLAEWTRINRSESLFRAIMARVEDATLAGPTTTGIIPEAFWASRPGTIYLSSGDGDAVKITAGEIRLVDNGADGVLFAAGRTLAPWQLTAPQDFFDTCRLFADIQDAADNARELVRLWTLSLPTNPKSKPPLCLFGEIGAGKTRLACAIAELYGLPQILATVEEKLEGDFWPTMDGGGLFVLDNADTRTRWLADAVANAATGGCVSRRRLYFDAETLSLRARAWLAITTSNPTFANDSGLADRLMVVRLKRRQGNTSDAALSQEIAANRDGALSFMAHTLAAALADTAPTPDGLNARHPDFAAFAVKIGRAIGREAQTIAALSAAESDKSLFCLQNDTLGAALLAHVTADTVLEGDAAALRTALAAHDSGISEWSNKGFGRRLSALWPHVAAVFDAKRTERRNGMEFRLARR